MTTQSLFGTLATRFSTQPENLATESLFYILNASRTAERAFLGYVARAGVNLGDNLLFQTQSHGKDKSIPDLVGVNAANEQVLVIESKFWASLTDNQPITYLDRLPKEKPGILLFIAPERRFPTLWAELLERLNRNEKPFQKSETDDGLLVVRLNAHHVMALVSWRAVLAVMEQSATAAQEMQVVSDIRQLSGLCERMDSEAFIPLQSEDLSSTIGMRIQQYHQLIEEVVARLRNTGLVSAKGLNSSGSIIGYGRYFKLAEYAASLQVNLGLWATKRDTPLWLRLQGSDWKYSSELRDKLQFLEHKTPSRLFQDGDWFAIPLYLPTGVEKSDVVEGLLAQIREIAEKIKD
jgi:hypothetical protein